MKQHYLKNQGWGIKMLIFLFGLSLSFSAKAATVTITKVAGTTIAPVYAPGDVLEISGAALEAADWAVLKGLAADEFHLELKTPNTQIPDNAMDGNYMVLSVTAPNVESIGDEAFYDCYGLTTVSFPKVTTIGDRGFMWSSLTSVSFPEVISIGDYAFETCNFSSGSFPKATTIGDYAFANSGLVSASFPEVTTMGESAFENSMLVSVSFPKATFIGEKAFTYCYELVNISLPEAVTIGDYAFTSAVELTSIDAPKVITIGEGAFQDCAELTSISFPEATSIGYYAFDFCYNVASISLPKISTIPVLSFTHLNSLRSVSLPAATLIESSAFWDCPNLASVVIPNVSQIDMQAFEDCSTLQALVLGNTPPVIDPTSFNNVSSLLLIVPDSTQYPAAVLADYPAGSEAFNKSVSIEADTLISGMPLTLTPDRIPTLPGGYYQWEKDGVMIPGANSATFKPEEGGMYTLLYFRGGQSVELMSTHVVSFPYDLIGTYMRYQGCEYTIQLHFPSSSINRDVEIWSEGTGAEYILDINKERYLNDTVMYLLPANDSIITLHYSVDEKVKDGSKFVLAYRISGSVTDRTTEFILYAKPEIKLVTYHPATVQYKGVLDISITNGSYYIQRSMDGGLSWQFARDTVTGDVLPFSQSQIAYFEPGSTILFRVPNGCSYEAIKVGRADDGIPEITRPVYMPSLSEAFCDINPGTHSILSGNDFVFTITPAGTNVGKALHVSTSRRLVPDSEGVLIENNPDGSFTVTILQIKEPVTIAIDFATGIDEISKRMVWASENYLHICSEKPGDAFVYTISGSLVQVLRVDEGETVTIPMNSGMYLVTLHNKTYKVIIQ